MELIKKEEVVFERDDNGELMPQTVDLIETDKQISIIPMTRAKVKQYLSGNMEDKDVDKDLIKTNCINPKFTEEEIDNMNPAYFTLIIRTILEHSRIQTTTSDGEVKKN